MPENIAIDTAGTTRIVSIRRPEARNAVDRATARALFEAFRDFDADPSAHVDVLTGSSGTFCSGADLRAIAAGDPNEVTTPAADQIQATPAPMGPTRLRLGKPVIAAIEGHAVAGGLELALWADLRVAAADSVLGVFCRTWGVPLIDGGTFRLPRIVGEGRALDLILTGRAVAADEALAIGLVNRVVEPGRALEAAVELADRIGAHPQECMRVDRAAAFRQYGLDEAAALAGEVSVAASLLSEGLVTRGARSFVGRGS